MKKLTAYLAGSMALIVLLIIPQTAGAGAFKKVKALTKSVAGTAEEFSRSSRQAKDAIHRRWGNLYEKTRTTNPVTGEWGTSRMCEGSDSVECEGQDDFLDCMHQTRNYYYRLVAVRLDQKLADGQDLADSRRQELQEDIASVKAAIETGHVIDPDPDEPQRWFGRLSRQDQIEINRLKSKYIREVNDDCNARFRGLRQYR